MIGNSVAVGYFAAGNTTQNDQAVAVGAEAGETSQRELAVAVGNKAGNNAQGRNAVSVGSFAGNDTQGASSVAVGYQAGKTTQGAASVAVGREAGEDTQGDYSTAVGYGAGRTSQGANGLIISSKGVAVDDTTEGHIHIASNEASINYVKSENINALPPIEGTGFSFHEEANFIDGVEQIGFTNTTWGTGSSTTFALTTGLYTTFTSGVFGSFYFANSNGNVVNISASGRITTDDLIGEGQRYVMCSPAGQLYAGEAATFSDEFLQAKIDEVEAALIDLTTLHLDINAQKQEAIINKLEERLEALESNSN